MADQKIAQYSLVKRIAVGGMAEVYIARRTGLQGFSKKIVIKRIRPHLSNDEDFINMFLNEARLTARLNHSNIAQIYDLGREGDCFFIAMEYVDGRDMRAVLVKAEDVGIPFPLEYSLKIGSAACEGLYYAHRLTNDDGSPLNIVHRDITPENLMVSFGGEVKILDFGIAKAANTASETKTGEIKGKLAYMSPEQITGKSIDARSDLFSLGVVLYEWITGQKLFGGGTDVEVMRKVIDAKIYPPGYHREGIPEPVEAILMRSLQRNREERYQSAWDMQYDIDHFLARHEFTPSNIHLSNFIRQLFADELSQEAQASKTEAESGKALAVSAPPLEETQKSKVPHRKESEAGEREKSEHVLPKEASLSVGEPQPESTLQPESVPALNAGPDLLEAELLASQNGHLLVNLDLERDVYLRLHAMAECHGLTVPELIADFIRQFTKYSV